MNNLLVSIITPTYNSASMLKRAIDSVIAQSYENWEMLIVDNNSQDDTKIIIENFNDERIKYFSIDNKGIIAKSRNLAILHAKGKWIAFLDADDWWLPDKLSFSVSNLQKGSEVIYHDLISKGPGSRFFSNTIKSRKLSKYVFQDLVLFGNALLNSSVVVSSSLIKKAGKLSEDPDLVGSEDYEYWLRIARCSEKFSRIPLALGFYWIGTNNVTNPNRTITGLTKLRKRFYDESLIIHSPFWMAFAIAKAYLKVKKFNNACFELKNINKFKLSAVEIIKIKILYFLIFLIKFKKNFFT
jgi:glycosyltransferase involved in cell wall biosynthesis